MLKDITIGQHYPSNSVIHRLDARIKLIATFVFMASLFIINKFWPYAIVFISLLAVIKLSNIPFVNGLGWVDDYYSILSVNGDKLFVDTKKLRTYDENNNLVDQVNESRIDLIIKNVINEIKDKLYL